MSPDWEDCSYFNIDEFRDICWRKEIFLPFEWFKKTAAVSIKIILFFTSYVSSFNFYIQGNYDGIDYVDGYMYTDVHVPLTVQTIMSIEIDFSL